MANFYTNIKGITKYLFELHDQLGLERFAYADIHVDFSDDPEIGGSCTGDQDEVFIEVSADLPLQEAMVVIAHEMVHAAQLLNGRLHQLALGRMYFEGKRVDQLPYQERPHEIEAYFLENHLYEVCR